MVLTDDDRIRAAEYAGDVTKIVQELTGLEDKAKVTQIFETAEASLRLMDREA